MKVFIDGRMLYMSGIGRYIRNIIKGTLAADDSLEYLIAGDVNEISKYMKEEISLQNRAAIKTAPYNKTIYSTGEQLAGSRLVRENNSYDLMFFPHYNAPYYLSSNSVVTVHDLIHFKFAYSFDRAKVLFARQVLKNAVNKTGKIITVSESTKNDLQEMFPRLAEDKIKVIYQGVSSKFRAATDEELKAYKKKRGLSNYLLFVGNRKPHKNLSRLIEAYAGLIKEMPGLQLVIAGQRFAPIDEVDLLKKKYQLANLLEFSDLTDAELPFLYSGAEALVFPSLYEGFGLPVLEAMSCNTPVILSGTSSLPEVAGAAGVYFNPYNIEEIGTQIYNVLKDAHLRENLKQRGIEQARKFSWAKTSDNTLKVFKQAAADDGRGI